MNKGGRRWAGREHWMTHITKIAAVEMVTAIWEYDPSLPDNRVLNGSLDVTAAIQTLVIKVGHLY